ncbi:MAG: TIR domain-containing protein [Polyangiaceae bacterium]
MTGVFISHAAADKPLVDPFVDEILRLGCEIAPGEIFYSSGEDTGIPSGEDLNSYVRSRVGDASLVVAIISPTFQTRPFCVAELGAAWAKVGNLFPIAVPGMPRTDLEGVLVGMLVKYLDDGSALDELHTRLGEAVGHTTKAGTWNRFREKWLANVDHYVSQLPPTRTATVRELDQLRDELEGARQALHDSEAELRKLERQVRDLAAAKSAEDVAEILMPDDEVERFNVLRSTAADRVRRLDSIVADAMWSAIFEYGMPWPYEDQRRMEQAEEAKKNGLLIENSSDLLVPDDDVREVADAYEAVSRLRAMLGETSEEFGTWFKTEYGAGPNLQKKMIWDAVLYS